jgi:hypothetical protein
MNNRHNLRAAAVKAREVPPFNRDGLIRLTLVTPAATGGESGTLILPDGCTLYLSADDARALHGREAPRGCRT